MTLPRISVIVPCYNAAGSVGPLLDSLLDGAPANLEVLLVDDGSTDDTAALCRRYAAREPRLRLLGRPNGGPAAARNTGLAAATGEWVMFADADDALLPGLWDALPPALASGAAMVLFGMTRASGPVPCPLGPGLWPDLASLGPALAPLLFESGYLAAPYAKLFCRAALGGLRFDEGLQINEDVLFNIQFLHFSQKGTAIYSLPGVYYKQYDLSAGSVSRRLRGDLLAAEAVTRPALEGMLKDAGLPDDVCRALAEKSRLRACLNQYGVLTGRRGAMSFGERRALFAEILGYPPARRALQAQLKADPHRLLALPYRLALAAGSPGLLAAYTLAKQGVL